jgi:hypothetical protein
MLLMRKGIARRLSLLLLAIAAPAAAQRLNVTLDLRCAKEAFGAGEPVICFIEIVNHGSSSHLVYVPTSLFPARVAGWPPALMELDVRRDGESVPRPNLWLSTGTLDMVGFNEHSLQPLDFGRLVGWEVELRHGPFWQYQLEAGRYRIRAHVRADILGAMKGSKQFSEAVRRALGNRFRDAGGLLLNGELASNEVTVLVN